MPYIHDFSIDVLSYPENRYREPTSYLHRIVEISVQYDYLWQWLATYPDILEVKQDSLYTLHYIQSDLSMLRNVMNTYMHDATIEQAKYIRIYQDFAKLIYEKAKDLESKIRKDIEEMDH